MNVRRCAHARVLRACTKNIDIAAVQSFRPWVFERLVSIRAGGFRDDAVEFASAIADLVEGS